jgi:hypothetical protein
MRELEILIDLLNNSIHECVYNKTTLDFDLSRLRSIQDAQSADINKQPNN